MHYTHTYTHWQNDKPWNVTPFSACQQESHSGLQCSPVSLKDRWEYESCAIILRKGGERTSGIIVGKLDSHTVICFFWSYRRVTKY